MKRFFAEPTRLIFLGTLALLIIANHAFLFVTPWHEDGDFALNALQIERAKHLNEFYGNYSRFHFNHPGPAFFYVYAAGEYVLYDWLQVVPSPHNAHAIAGTVLQVLFFAVALGIAAAWIRARWFIPISLALGGLHFGLGGNAFTSIWPPHVLLMPFLCFLIAGASVAAGRPRHLPLMVIAGCFLVHGHVAQPLMVGLLFIASYALYWRSTRVAAHASAMPWKIHVREHWLAATCIALFSAPLIVDAALGSDSNFAQIVEFMQAKKDHRTLLESAVYLLSFLCYQHDQEWFIKETGVIDFAFLRERIALCLAWLALVPLVLWGVRRLASAPQHAERHRFLTALLQVLAVGFIAALLWGWIQTGPMFEFNAHFFYALTYAFLISGAATLALVLPERRALVWPGAATLCVVGALTYGHFNKRPPSANSASIEWSTVTAAAVQQDPKPRAQKFLVFNHDDWGDVARTALALKRLGHSYRTDENWRFMFGRYRTIDSENLDALDGYSIWRFSKETIPGRSAPLGKGLRVYFDPSPLDPAHATISCRRGGNLPHFAIFGFTTPDGESSWTNLPKAALQFQSVAPAARDIEISITAEPFLYTGCAEQPLELSVNGRKIASFSLTGRKTLNARIPADTWNLRPTVTVVFDFPRAQSPLRLGFSTDPRQLAWAISEIAFRSAP